MVGVMPPLAPPARRAARLLAALALRAARAAARELGASLAALTARIGVGTAAAVVAGVIATGVLAAPVSAPAERIDAPRAGSPIAILPLALPERLGLFRSGAMAPDLPADPAADRRVERLLAALRRGTGSPAISAAVRYGDGRVVAAAVGMADAHRRVTPAMAFGWASVSKVAAAALAVGADAAGLLPLSSRLSSYLAVPRLSRSATIADLLRHRAGAGDQLGLGYYGVASRDGAANALAAALRAGRTPYGRFEYSNAGYVFVGAAIERALDRSYTRLLREELFTPAGMEHTWMGGREPGRAPVVRGWSGGWMPGSLADGATPNRRILTVAGAAGGLVGTPADMARMGLYLFGQRGLADYRARLGPRSGDYTAAGARDIWVPGHGAGIGHSGDLSGARTCLVYLPGEDVAVAVAGNADGFEPCDLVARILDAAGQ
jgi:CubicO group peptidase (beta-lactamase class C family)